MIDGAHFLLYSSSPDADRDFLRDVLGLSSVDAGRGWLIFALPPSEIAVHPLDEGASATADGVVEASLYLMCDDLKGTMTSLESKGVRFADVHEERWGIVTTFRLPGGGKVGLYQPLHPRATS